MELGYITLHCLQILIPKEAYTALISFRVSRNEFQFQTTKKKLKKFFPPIILLSEFQIQFLHFENESVK